MRDFSLWGFSKLSPAEPPETDLLSLQQGSRPKVKPTLALNHKARQQRAKARLGQIFNSATASEPLLAGSKGIRKLEEWDRDSENSGSDRLGSESSDDSRRERRPSNASFVEDLGIWTVKTAAHRALLHLRSCRVKLIHRFGGVDKAYIRCVPALTGMTAEVFQQLSNLMGFTGEEATEMFDLMKSHRPPKKRRASATGARSFSKQEPIDRQEFAEVMRKATTVKGLVQLRRRLRMKHTSCEAATTAAFGKRQALDRETFRDFMIQNGITGREAYHHFMKMSKNNEAGGLAEKAERGEQEENPQVSRFAFLKTLLHAEGLEAAEAFKAELVELLFNRGGHAGLASDQRGRRTAAVLSQELLSGLSEGVDRVWDEVELPSPPVAKRRKSKSLVSQNRGNRTIQASLGITAETERTGPTFGSRRFSAAGPGGVGGRRLSASAASGMQVGPMAAQLKQELSLILSSQEQAVPEGGTSKHFNFNANGPSTSGSAVATMAPSSTSAGPRRASFSGSTAAMLHAGAAALRRRSVDEVPPSALRRRSLAQPASGGLLLSGNHVNLEPQESSGSSGSSASDSEHLQKSHLGLLRKQRHSSSASGLSGISHGSRRSSLSSSSGMSDTSRHSSFSHHSETQYDKVLIKVFETLVCPKVDLWEPISRDHFVYLIKHLRLGEDASKAIFKLSARADGRSSPGDVLLRALGGFGRKYRKLRELLGLKVDFSSRQSSKRPSVAEPEVEVVEAEAPKTELSLGIGISDDSELQEEKKDKAKKQLRKAVKKIGLTFHLSKSEQNEPTVSSTSEKVPGMDLEVFSSLSTTEMKGSDATPSSRERRASQSAVNQVALDLSMLGSKSTPRRRSSFSGYAVRRSSTTAFGETGRRMSFDADGIFGQLTEPGEAEEEETWDFDDAAWQSRASKDEAGAIPMAAMESESNESAISEPLKAIAEAEVRNFSERRKLFDGEALQFSMALEALQEACWTLQRSFKGCASRAFEYLANFNETLDDAELRDALTEALSDTPSLSIPVWQVEGMVQVLLRIDGQELKKAGRILATNKELFDASETLSKNLFQRALHFLQPCLNLSQLRTRLVARYGTMEAGLQVIREGIDEVKALSVDQFEPRIF
eukprot:symbB.v1.2.026704.t1/scaffold2692.1/size74767/1